MVEKAQAKRARKGCDWIIGNDVSWHRYLGGMTNTVHMVDGKTVENWPTMTKNRLANSWLDGLRTILNNHQSRLFP